MRRVKLSHERHRIELTDRIDQTGLSVPVTFTRLVVC